MLKVWSVVSLINDWTGLFFKLKCNNFTRATPGHKTLLSASSRVLALTLFRHRMIQSVSELNNYLSWPLIKVFGAHQAKNISLFLPPSFQTAGGGFEKMLIAMHYFAGRDDKFQRSSIKSLFKSCEAAA